MASCTSRGVRTALPLPGCTGPHEDARVWMCSTTALASALRACCTSRLAFMAACSPVPGTLMGTAYRPSQKASMRCLSHFMSVLGRARRSPISSMPHSMDRSWASCHAAMRPALHQREMKASARCSAPSNLALSPPGPNSCRRSLRYALCTSWSTTLSISSISASKAEKGTRKTLPSSLWSSGRSVAMSATTTTGTLSSLSRKTGPYLRYLEKRKRTGFLKTNGASPISGR
mmetsp:Transcript_13544/g.28971  ORF Transcript_13544/g.28971 Transcript_13544/m.28971 type:complete len:231 (+) Transcript_13544:1551-2243(+)